MTSSSQWYSEETEIQSILRGKDVTATFQELARIRNGLITLKQEKLQKQEKLFRNQREHERVKTSLEKRFSDLEKKKKEMQKRISSTQKNAIPTDLQRQRTDQTKDGTKRLMWVHREYIAMILDYLRRDLNDLLSCKPDAPSVADTKDVYRFYGFLLSACNLKDAAARSNDQKVQKVYDSLKRIDHRREELKPHIEKAVDLTRSMLILQPPLVVCQPKQYEEDVHDTNRLTWDEKKAHDQLSTAPLIYYRPVLVYGNQLEVAVKGLVGNSLVEIRERAEQEGEPSNSSSGRGMDSAGSAAQPGDQKMPMHLRQSRDTSSSSRQQQSESKEMDRPWKNRSDPRLTKPPDKFQGYPPSTSAPDKAAKDSDVSEFDPLIQNLQEDIQDFQENIQKLQRNQDKSTTTSTWKTPGRCYRCTVCGKPVEAPNAVPTGDWQFAHITCCRCAHCPNNGYWIINNGQILCSYHFRHVQCPYCPAEGLCQVCGRTWSYPSSSQDIL